MLQQAFQLTLADATAIADDPDQTILRAYLEFQVAKRRQAIMASQRAQSQKFLEVTR